MRHSSLSSVLAWLCALAAISCGGGDTGDSSGTQVTGGSPSSTATVTAGKPASPPAAETTPNKPSGTTSTPNTSPAAGGHAAPSSTAAAGTPSTAAPSAGSPAAQAGSSAAGAPAANSGTAGAAASAGHAAEPPHGTPTLFYLDNAGSRVMRSGADGAGHKVIVSGQGVGPDGVAVDVANGHVFWTNMGLPSSDDGTIIRTDLDGKNPMTIIPKGTFTPKQLKFEPTQNKLYWSDREGMRVMRANTDGTQLETLVSTGTDADRSDASHWCVGIAVDVAGGKIYWSQKGGDNAGQGTIKRANLMLPAGADPAKRDDIEVLFKNLPEPIDLDLDLEHRMLYWTDRGDNTVSRAPLEPPAGFDPAARKDREILVKGLAEAIGITLDLPRNRMYYTSLGGVVAGAALDGTGAKDLITGQGTLTGIVLVDL